MVVRRRQIAVIVLRLGVFLMRLQYSIAITLGFITCLSSFMLGLGQEDFLLPFLMFLAAATSIYVTDFRQWIRLGNWTINVLILLIVFSTIWEIMSNLLNYRNEALAFSIARTLVFVEMALLFREKSPRFCWQILLISLLQVVVASIMLQGLLFGFLLLVYIFSGLCAFVLIFLQSEYRYYRRHSYVNTFLDSLKAEIAARQDHGRLVRIALVTLLTGPLSLVFSFSPDKKEGRGKKSSRWDLIRSLFAVFPADDVVGMTHWETIREPRRQEMPETGPTDRQRHWHADLWNEEGETLKNGDGESMLSNANWTSVPKRALKSKRNRSGDPSDALPVFKLRFPLLAEFPAFSAGTVQHGGLEGGRWELIRHIFRGTLFALAVAILVFFMIPRTGKIDFWTYEFSFGKDHDWARSFRNPVNTVGFSESVRLGSLGSVIPYHKEVLSVRFMKNLDGKIPADAEAAREVPYTELHGGTVYLRGIALEHYSGGIWSNDFHRRFSHQDSDSPFQEELSQQSSPPFPTPFFRSGLRPGSRLLPETGDILFFEDDSDLLHLYLNVEPLDTTVFFAPWPFFFSGADSNTRLVTYVPGSVRERGRRSRPLSTAIYSTAFKHGTQLPVIPNQERVVRENLLQMPERGLDALAELAKRWDDDSGFPKEDIIGRALNMENRFLYSGQFNYKLGGTVRNYGADPLEDFIGSNPSGHCEYFAGALALMLRSVGIGSRVVVGFKSYAMTPDRADMTIRQSDAHAWVEVYLPPESLGDRPTGKRSSWWGHGGWLRLDPTPAAPESTMMDGVSFRLTDLREWIQSFWGEYVLNMNAQKQGEWIYGPIRQGFSFLAYRVFNISFWREAVPEMILYYKSLLFMGRDKVWEGRDWLLLALPVVILLTIAFLVFHLFSPCWRWLFRESEEARRRKATVEFYVAMERLLSRIRERRRDETPLEYVHRFALVSPVVSLVDAYYRVRFGGALLSGEELKEIKSVLVRLEKEIGERHESTRP